MVEYEVTYILRPSLEEAQADERCEAIAQIVSKQGGTVHQVEKLGKKRLAYEIGGVREGYYAVMTFAGEPAVAKELERQLKLHEDVVRALLVRLDPRIIAARAAHAAGDSPAQAV
jgi:small subunit ribosomal protein S6